MNRDLVWCLIVLTLSIVPAAARATVVVPADLNELVRGSLAIVRGRVVSVQAREGDGRRIERLVRVHALSYYKGDLGEDVMFRVPGGTLGRYRTLVIGAPEYVEGEEVVLFLNARGPSMPYVLGLFQGTYRVTTDELAKTRVVVPAGLQATSRTERVVRGDGSRDPIALSAFEAQLRQLVATASAAGARP
ncbi:MAG: hypothetical protein GEU99_11240 [Luteitalea sp.]|nr:hypothetical protein [Luteitalea sp.]